MFKKAVVLFLSTILVLCMFGFVSAAETELAPESDISPRWTLINRVSNTLSINSNGLASMTSFISAYDGVDSVRISAFLQREEGNSWVTVNSWTEDYNGTLGYWQGNWYVAKGYNYRLVTFFWAYAGYDQDSTNLCSVLLKPSKSS